MQNHLNIIDNYTLNICNKLLSVDSSVEANELVYHLSLVCNDNMFAKELENICTEHLEKNKNKLP